MASHQDRRDNQPMTPIEQREKTMALHLRFTAFMAVQSWIDCKVLQEQDGKAQILAILLEACKDEAEGQGLPFERIIAEVTR